MKSDLKVAIAGVLFAVMILALIFLKTPLGFDPDIDVNYIQLFPGLFVIIVCMLMIVYTKGMFGLPGMFVIGMGLVHLSNTMYDMGLITDQMLTGLTIAQYNLWILVILTIAGGILTSVSYRGR